VVWVLPRAFPHKEFAGVGLETRLAVLKQIAEAEAGFSVAVADGGLYAEIADEALQWFGGECEVGIVCGRDAAERMANWDYGRPGVFEAMIEKHPLLVARRAGDWESSGVIRLAVDPVIEEVSSSEVRRRMAAGEPWRELTPPVAAEAIAAAWEPAGTDRP
jgi:nicotinic acid mononucleotide adenylyltransferase